MSNQKNMLQIAWQKRLELHTEGDKLRAEGNKLYAEADKLCGVGHKLRVVGHKLYAEGYKLHTEGHKLRAEGDILFYTAVINQYGKDAVVEFNEKGCQIESSLGTINLE